MMVLIRRFSNSLSYLVLTLFVLLAAVQAPKKFILDEIDFPIVSQAASLTGTPVYYRGEANAALPGNYHPTLYIHSLAAFIKVFGYSEITVRLFGVVCVLLSLAFIAALARLWWPAQPGYRRAFFYLFGAVFLLHPYVLASALLPDIDSTVLPVTMLAFIYAGLALARRADRSRAAAG
ncbi:MAG: hypothetical protein WCI73_08200, partial [Phycisphaerae bacterium]